MVTAKNFAVSGAAGDLGLGDVLQNETEEQVTERRRKLMMMQQQGPADYGALSMGSAAVMSLGLGPKA